MTVLPNSQAQAARVVQNRILGQEFHGVGNMPLADFAQVAIPRHGLATAPAVRRCSLSGARRSDHDDLHASTLLLLPIAQQLLMHRVTGISIC
jgi:hypothetical protein